MRFHAIREIRKNQPITFSPINNYEWSREERRLNLLEERNIDCKCERCLGPDDNRGIKCLKVLVIQILKNIYNQIENLKKFLTLNSKTFS